MTRTIRLAAVDDHTLFRSALAQLLDTQPDIDVVGTGGDAQSALDLVTSTKPDVLLLDVDLPGPGAEATVSALRKAAPRLNIVMLSMYDSPATIQSLLKLGVRGYLLKSCSDAELLAAVRKVATDPRHVVLSVTARLFDAEPASDQVDLSEREVEILGLAATALSNRQIAREIGVKESTVKRHLHNVFVKLDATSRIDAVNKAGAAGLLPDASDD